MHPETLFIFPFSILFFVWIVTFFMMMRFRSLYNRACQRERRYAEMVEQLTGRSP